VGEVTIRKSWCVVWVGLGLVLCLAGCQALFPKPVYTPPRAPAPTAPPPVQVVRPTFYVAVARLNLRACPGMDCPKIAVIDRNEEVEKLGDAEDWSQIRVKRDGTIGWVSSRYLSATPVAAPPEAPTPPLPEPEKVKPTPEKPPAVEMPKPAKPTEGPKPAIKKKPEEAKPAKPVTEEAPPPAKPAPEKPLIPEKPAKPAPPAAKPTPPEKPAPPPTPGEEKPSQIRIM
jgi:hypothetical protein